MIKSRSLRWTGHVARMGESRIAFKILTGTPSGKRPLGRPQRRWEGNIRLDLKEISIKILNIFEAADIQVNVQICLKRIKTKRRL